MKKEIKKNQNIFTNKWVIIALLVVVVIATICVVLFVFILPKMNEKMPTQTIFAINNKDEAVEAKLGNYVWGENTVDVNKPYEIAKTHENVLNAPRDSAINLAFNKEKGKKLENISNVYLTLIKDDQNVEEVSTSREENAIIFVAPDSEGIYYYCLKLEYSNGNSAEYVFEVRIEVSIQNKSALDQIIETYKDKYLGDNVAVAGLVDDLEKAKKNQLKINKREFEIDSENLILTINYYVNDKNDVFSVIDSWAIQTYVPVILLLNNCNSVVINIIGNTGDVYYISKNEKKDIVDQFQYFELKDSIYKVFEESE